MNPGLPVRAQALHHQATLPSGQSPVLHVSVQWN